MLRIGISACFFHHDSQRPLFKGKRLVYMEESLIHWLLEKDVITVLIPILADHSSLPLEAWISELDGLVLQGGDDVSPTSYGETPLKPEWSGDRVRDAYEIELIHGFRSAGKPVFGLCRGAQIMNVAFGGSLYQDIQTQVPESLVHRNWDLYEDNHHDVSIEPGSWMSQWYEDQTLSCINSIHHQGIKDLGKGLMVEARSKPDGIIEAVRHQSGPFTFGCQWHPEFQRAHETGLLNREPIIEEFLAAAREAKRG